MKYRGDIDGLRGVAVVAVVVFHAEPLLLPGGYVGVDMFFVVSGFLISGILWDQIQAGTLSLAAFYARRAWRLLPALYVTLAATLTASFALFPPTELRRTAYSTISAVASVSNFRFAMQTGYFDDSAYRKPLLHTWSLAIEEQFYFLWPAVLLLLYRNRRHLSKALALPALLALIGLSELAARTKPTVAYFILPFRIYQFLSGAALHLMERPASTILQETLALTGVVCTALSLSLYSGTTPFPGIAALLPTLGTAALIHAPRSMISLALANPVLAGTGRISYSVYLVHWPLIVAYSLLSASDKFERSDILFLVASSLALGYALHHSVEARYRRGPPGCDDTSPAPAPVRTFALFAGLGVALCAAAYGGILLVDVVGDTTPPAEVAYAMTASADLVNQTDPIVEEAVLWENELCEHPNEDWKVNLRKRPGLVESIGQPSAGSMRSMHLKYKPPEGARGRMLLFGDSHAETLKPLALRMALEKDFELDAFTMPACSALLSLPSEFTIDREWWIPHCKAEQKFWRQNIEQTPYDLVLFSTRWMYLTEEVEYGEYKIGRRLFLNRRGEKPDTETLRERFTKRIGETVDFVLHSGARVMLIGQAPEVGKNIRGCLHLPNSKKTVEEGKIPEACRGVTRRAVLRRGQFTDTLFEQMGYANRRITAVTATKYFCDNFEEDHCRTVLGGRNLYTDDSHMSSFGSLYLAQRLKKNSYEGLDFNYRNPRGKRQKRRRR